MQFTATKSLARGYFYREFLPSHMTAPQLSNAEFLVLLGDDDMERLELDELNVPGSHIHSVEGDREVFARQLQRNRNNGSPVNLYFRQLDGLISDYLHSNKRLQVLNLDICGSYLTKIDPVMTKVLRFARRNTRTVIATYTNVGRDRQQLREGLKSLAICHLVAPEATRLVVNTLFGRYVAAKLSQEVSLNMVLRHLFWVRSHMEHVLLSGVVSGVLRSEAAAEYLNWMEDAWSKSATAAKLPLTYGGWLSTVDGRDVSALPDGKVFNLQIRDVELVTYAAANGFYHNGWFTVYDHSTPVTAQKWMEHALMSLIKHPLLFAAHGASRLEWFDGGCGLQLDAQPVWQAKELMLPCRHLPIPETSIGLMALEGELSKTEPAEKPTTSTSPSPEQRQIIRELAMQGMNTAQIMARLSEPLPPKASVTAYIASARRTKP